jgi:siroheme synthase
MGLGRSAAIACRLIDRGWSRGTPAAVIVDASRPEQQVWRGTLDQLATEAVAVDACGAGTIVIGGVVAVGLDVCAEREGSGHAKNEKRTYVGR